MNDERSLDRRVTAWLRAEAPVRARPEVLAMTLSRVAGASQVHPLLDQIWPWRARSARVSRSRIGLLVAAEMTGALVAVLLIVGFLGGAWTTGPDRTLGPSPSPTPSLGPSGVATDPPFPTSNGPIGAGNYRIAATFDVPLGIHVAVPAGWVQSGWAIQKVGVDEMLSFWTVQDTYVDPCHWKTSVISPRVGPSVDDLVEALRGQVGRTVTEPTPVTVAGFSGQRLTLVVPDDIGTVPCDEGEYRNWVLPGDGAGSRWVPVQVGYAGYTDTVWIIDADGIRLVIDATESPRATEADRSELRSIVSSIEIDELTAGTQVGDCTLVLGGGRSVKDQPYEVRLGASGGAVTLTAHGSGWGVDGPGRPEVSLRGPAGQLVSPGVSLGGGVLDTSERLDMPGRWHLRVSAWSVACFMDLPIEVLAADTG